MEFDCCLSQVFSVSYSKFLYACVPWEPNLGSATRLGRSTPTVRETRVDPGVAKAPKPGIYVG